MSTTMADVSPNAPTRRQLPLPGSGEGVGEPATAGTGSGTTVTAAQATTGAGADGRPVKAKRKRLSKACDACHKSKRRCDGTAPCSNCYFAEKECVYTNAAGRLVAAPRPPRNLAPVPDTDAQGAHHHHHARKRAREDDDSRALDLDRPHGGHSHSTHLSEGHDGHQQHPAPHGHAHPPPPLDPSLMHELINLFFAHCHPQRLVIHKPSFHAQFAKNLVPLHLLYAMCALSAMYSRRSSLRAGAPTPRLVGVPFANAAQEALFDQQGRLQVPPDLSAVQALVLLEMAHFTAHLDGVQEGAYQGPPRRAGLALDIARRLLGENSPGVGKQSTVERECTRRAMWLTYTLGLMGHLFLNRTDAHQRRRCIDVGMRLPLDETRFELAELMGSTEPEYLHIPAAKTPYASEYGHWIRTTTISFDLKLGLTEAGEDQVKQRDVIERIEHELRVWEDSLPDHLTFSQDGLAQQMSMFETGANAGAWCYCMFHTTYASTVLAADTARATLGLGPPVDRYHWAAERLRSVVDSLGTRARNSPLKAVAIFPLYPLYGPNDPVLRSWQADIADLWEIRVVDLATDMENLKVVSGNSPAILGASVSAFPHGTSGAGVSFAAAGVGIGMGSGMAGLSGPGRGVSMSTSMGSSVSGSSNVLEGPGMPLSRTSPPTSMFGPSSSLVSPVKMDSSSPPTSRRHYEYARTSPGSDRAERYREAERDSSPSSHGSVVSNSSRYSDRDGVRSRESVMTNATSWDGGGPGGMASIHSHMHAAHPHPHGTQGSAFGGGMLSGPGSMGAGGAAPVRLPSLKASGLLGDWSPGAPQLGHGHAHAANAGMAPSRRAPNGMPWLADEMR